MGSDQLTDELPAVVYWIAALTIAIVAIWDGYAQATGQEHMTITEIIYLWSRKWPLLPFVAGMVAGHLFWRKR